jgi:hypothetical protein
MIRWEVDIVNLRVRYDSYDEAAVNEWLERNPGWEPISFEKHSGYNDEVLLKVKRSREVAT